MLVDTRRIGEYPEPSWIRNQEYLVISARSPPSPNEEHQERD